jgi:hypothetical protein
MWLYLASHGQLLLRSVKDAQHPTQVDVLFKNVAAMSIPTLFSGLRVSEVSSTEARGLHLALGAWELSDRRVFKLAGDGWEGAVIASIVLSREDDADYFSESALMSG